MHAPPGGNIPRWWWPTDGSPDGNDCDYWLPDGMSDGPRESLRKSCLNG